MDDDFNVEDVLGNLDRKKDRKKNTSKDKGNRGERDLIKLLSPRFADKSFFRVVGSGARTSQVGMNEENKAMFTGDIVCPAGFRFSIECKYGYADTEVADCFPDGHKKIDGWLEQAQRDADSLARLPLLCWRKPRHPWLAFVPLDIVQELTPSPRHSMRYRDYGAVALTTLLAQNDEFWFRAADRP